MRLAGFTPRARLDVRSLPDAMKRAVRPEVVYDHRCPVCGVNRIAGRPVRRWRCRACVEAGREGRLEIVTRSFKDVAS